MTEEVRISPDGSRILVTSSGQPSLGEMKQTLATIRELHRAHAVDKVLVDSRARISQPSIADLFHGGEMLAQQIGCGARVAVLIGERKPEHGFFETVAVNRGASVAFFEDENAALGWLSKSGHVD